ncbi:MAG TPA: FecR family protein [Terriglobales bacterium]|nr:FecR family protein [Terriglobales bacterium]
MARFPFLRGAIAVVLCVLISPLPYALAQAGQRAGEVGALVPTATRNAGNVKVKDSLAWNDFLRTQATGRLRANLVDGSLLSMGSNSEMRVVQHDGASQQTQLELNYGRLRSRVVQLTKPGAKFEVKTPHAVIGVIGTDFYVFVDADRTLVIVFTGKVSIVPLRKDPNQPDSQATPVPPGIDVDGGQMAEVRSGHVEGPSPTPLGVQQDSIESTTVQEQERGRGMTNRSKIAIITGIVLGVAIAIALSTTRSEECSTSTSTSSSSSCSSPFTSTSTGP